MFPHCEQLVYFVLYLKRDMQMTSSPRPCPLDVPRVGTGREIQHRRRKKKGTNWGIIAAGRLLLADYARIAERQDGRPSSVYLQKQNQKFMTCQLHVTG